MIVQNLLNLKIVTQTQVDMSYFNTIANQVFSDSNIYANIQSDVMFINQMGTQLFNYGSSNPDLNTQKIWYVALSSGLTQSISDANSLINKIPVSNPKGNDLITVLNVFIADCQSIQKIIPIDQNSISDQIQATETVH